VVYAVNAFFRRHKNLAPRSLLSQILALPKISMTDSFCDAALEQAAQEVAESPSLEIFKTCLDKVLCNLP